MNDGSGLVWWREDRVMNAMQAALNAVVTTHGNKAKGIAWDVRSAFRKALEEAHGLSGGGGE